MDRDRQCSSLKVSSECRAFTTSIDYPDPKIPRVISASLPPSQTTTAFISMAHPASGSSNKADLSRVEDVMSLIRREWSFMTESECIPVQVALQLMDSSSLGRAHQDGHFLDTYRDLQQALKGIVNGMAMCSPAIAS